MEVCTDLRRSDRVFGNFLALKDFSEGQERVGLRERIRNNIRARHAACDECYSAYENAREEGYSGSFLDWLVENADEIFALIKKILALFGV